jgi:hypothetical protein
MCQFEHVFKAEKLSKGPCAFSTIIRSRPDTDSDTTHIRTMRVAGNARHGGRNISLMTNMRPGCDAAGC